MKTDFFRYLDFALQFSPAQENEKEIRAQLARMGIGPGKTFDFKDLSLEEKLEVGLGMKEGERKVEEAVGESRRRDQWLAYHQRAGRCRQLQRRLDEARVGREGRHLRQQPR